MNLEQMESIAREAEIRFKGTEVWFYDEDSPHTSDFKYVVETVSGEEKRQKLVEVNGYRIIQEPGSGDDESAWEEADAMDADAVTYVDSLIREFLACNKACDNHQQACQV